MRILIALFLSLIALSSHAQLEKAVKLIEANRKLPKALVLIEEYEKIPSGATCGNGQANWFWDIHFWKSVAYYKMGEHRKALGELDTIPPCFFGGDCERSDSMKVVVLAAMIGKDTLKSIVDSFCNRQIQISDSARGALEVMYWEEITLANDSALATLDQETLIFYNLRFENRLCIPIEAAGYQFCVQPHNYPTEGDSRTISLLDMVKRMSLYKVLE